MGIFGMFMAMRDHDDGGAGFVEFGQKLHHLFAIGGVEVAGRLVGQDQLGTRHHGAGDGDALLLAAGQLLRHVPGAMGDLDPLQCLAGALLAFARRNILVVEQRQLDIFGDIQFVDQVEALEHEPDGASCAAPTAWLRCSRRYSDRRTSIRRTTAHRACRRC